MRGYTNVPMYCNLHLHPKTWHFFSLILLSCIWLYALLEVNTLNIRKLLCLTLKAILRLFGLSVTTKMGWRTIFWRSYIWSKFALGAWTFLWGRMGPDAPGPGQPRPCLLLGHNTHFCVSLGVKTVGLTQKCPAGQTTVTTGATAQQDETLCVTQWVLVGKIYQKSI